MIIRLAVAPPIGDAERARDAMSTQEWYIQQLYRHTRRLVPKTHITNVSSCHKKLCTFE